MTITVGSKQLMQVQCMVGPPNVGDILRFIDNKYIVRKVTRFFSFKSPTGVIWEHDVEIEVEEI